MIKWVLISLIFLNAQFLVGQSLEQIFQDAKELKKEGKFDKALEILEKPVFAYIESGAKDSLACETFFLVSRLHSDKVNFEKSYNLAFQVKDLCEEVGYKELWIESISIIINLSSFYQQYDTLFTHTNLFINDKDIPLSFKSDAYSALSGLYQHIEKVDSSIYYALKATRIDSINQDSSSIPFSYFHLGTCYSNNYQYELALEKMLYGRSYVRKMDAYKIPEIDIRIASIYYYLGNINKAYSLTESALEVAQKIGMNIAQTNAYLMLAICQNYKEDFQAAYNFYQKADSLNKIKINNPLRNIQCKVGMAQAKLNMGEMLSANEMAVLRKLQSDAKEGNQQNWLNFLFLRIEDNSIAEFESKYEEYFQQSDEKNAEHLTIHLLHIKKEFYRKKGAYKKAIYVDNEIDRIQKRISQQNNEYIIQELDSKYRKQIQDREISYLEDQNENKSKIVFQQRITILLGGITLIIGTVLIMLLYRLFRKVNKQKDFISKALSDKDILIKEIHHRVKNNLQLVSSLLTLQGRDIDDEKAKSAIQDGKNRVRSMALIHQDLYLKETIKNINVKDYLEKLTTDLFLTYKIDQNEIVLQLDIDDVDLDVDTIVPLGLIINELITNAIKYAFKEGDQGILGVSLKEKNNVIELIIIDNGVGFNAENIRKDSFGTTMIKALTRQLNATITTDTSKGTNTKLVFNIA